MSKHIFTQSIDGEYLEVQIGWDKPTQGYYGLILGWVNDPDADQGGYFDDLIWSSIYLPDEPLTLEAITEEITQRGFILPENLLDNVRADRLRNAVNEHRFYQLEEQSWDLHPS